jgi:hypothetical protein
VKSGRGECWRSLAGDPRAGATILDKTRLGVKNSTAQLRLVLSLRFFGAAKSDVKIHEKTQRRSL